MAKNELKLHVSDDNVITIEDSSGGITIKNSSGAVISVGSEGITLDNGKGSKIVLGASGVKINGTQVDVNSEEIPKEVMPGDLIVWCPISKTSGQPDPQHLMIYLGCGSYACHTGNRIADWPSRPSDPYQFIHFVV